MIAASSIKQGGDDKNDIAAKIHRYALAGEDEKILVRLKIFTSYTYYFI